MAYGEFHTVAAKSGGWRVAAAGSERFIFIGAASLAPLEKNLAQLSYAMIAAAVPGILLIAAMGGFLAARALRPVSRLTQAAEQITARGLDRRMPATRESAEFQRLTDVFNSMLDRLDKSFQQATRFSADAAHELKTPLAILQGQLEQSLREASDSSPQQKLCADLLEEVQRLKTIIRKLLLLSLADAGELRLNLERRRGRAHPRPRPAC
jgi:signal transduction histidine kinase